MLICFAEHLEEALASNIFSLWYINDFTSSRLGKCREYDRSRRSAMSTDEYQTTTGTHTTHDDFSNHFIPPEVDDPVAINRMQQLLCQSYKMCVM